MQVLIAQMDDDDNDNCFKNIHTHIVKASQVCTYHIGMLAEKGDDILAVQVQQIICPMYGLPLLSPEDRYDHDNYSKHCNIEFYSSLIQVYRDIAIIFIQQQAGDKTGVLHELSGRREEQRKSSSFTNQTKTHFHCRLAKLNYRHLPSILHGNSDHVKRSIVMSCHDPWRRFQLLVSTGTKLSIRDLSSIPIRRVYSSTCTCFIIRV